MTKRVSQIQRRFKRQSSTINRLVKKYQHTSKTERSVGSGRKPKTSKRKDCCIFHAAKKIVKPP